MADLPDREDTVYKLRRFMGRVYAIGHQDGRMAASTEAYYDRNAPSARHSASPTPVQPPADHGDGSGTGGAREPRPYSRIVLAFPIIRVTRPRGTMTKTLAIHTP